MWRGYAGQGESLVPHAVASSSLSISLHVTWHISTRPCNVVYVTRDYYSVDKERNTFRVGDFNWISGAAPRSTPEGWVLGRGLHSSTSQLNLSRFGQ